MPAVCLRCPQVGYGEQFKIVGNQKELGSWDASKALELKWHEGDVWAATAELPVATDIEFKVRHVLLGCAPGGGAWYMCAYLQLACTGSLVVALPGSQAVRVPA